VSALCCGRRRRGGSWCWRMELGGDESPVYGKLAGELAGVGVATLRYQFPYMEDDGGFLTRPRC